MGNSRVGKNRQRQLAAAKNLARGMNPEEALVAAGYSPSTARKNGYAIVRQPYIQSLLTESCQRVLAMRHKQIDALLVSYVDALDARILFTNPQSGAIEETKIVDHAMRMK